MEVVVRDTKEQAAQLAAGMIAKAIQLNPDLVLGLATGRTMESVYKLLVEMHKTKSLDFSGVTTFNLDEYVGIPQNDPRSYRYYMNEHLFRHVNIDLGRTYLPNGMAKDIPTACRQYEARIQNCGGIDLQLLGIGRSGHIGFNEPLSALRSRTREKVLMPVTIAQNSPIVGDPAKMPDHAITMGVGTILESRECILLATGQEKADIIAKAVEGPITSMISATALQLHPICTVIVDAVAASCLQNVDHYRWIFEHESYWAEFR